MRWAVFLDRDGTINEEAEYLDDPAKLCLLPKAAEAIGILNRAGVPVILVTNQAGVGRGYFPESTVHAIHRELVRRLARQGAHLDAIYYCPHHPDAGCECRKPNPGMLLQAAKEHSLDLTRSFVVGDKVIDMEAGRRVGCRMVLVLTGYGTEAREAFRHMDFQPHYIATDLWEAVEWILAQRDSS